MDLKGKTVNFLGDSITEGVEVPELYERLPINPNIPEHKEKYTIDGLHFNAEGHKVIADTLIDFIEHEM